MDAQRPGSQRPSRDGRPARTGEEAPYTSESFEVDPDVGTDSPLGDASPDKPTESRSTSDEAPG